MTADRIQELNREADRVARLLEAAQRRQAESWDKPEGVQRRIDRTVAKHRAALRRIDAKFGAQA
jgi:hypothetical protein